MICDQSTKVFFRKIEVTNSLFLGTMLISKKFNVLLFSISDVNLMAGWRVFKKLQKDSTWARFLKSKNVSSTYRL